MPRTILALVVMLGLVGALPGAARADSVCWSPAVVQIFATTWSTVRGQAHSGWLADDHVAYNCVETEPAGPVSEDETDNEEIDFPASTVVEAPPAEAPATVAAVAPSYRDKGKHAHKGKRGKHAHKGKRGKHARKGKGGKHAYRDQHKHDGDERSKHRGKRGRGKKKH